MKTVPPKSLLSHCFSLLIRMSLLIRILTRWGPRCMSFEYRTPAIDWAEELVLSRRGHHWRHHRLPDTHYEDAQSAALRRIYAFAKRACVALALSRTFPTRSWQIKKIKRWILQVWMKNPGPPAAPPGRWPLIEPRFYCCVSKERLRKRNSREKKKGKSF